MAQVKIGDILSDRASKLNAQKSAEAATASAQVQLAAAQAAEAASDSDFGKADALAVAVISKSGPVLENGVITQVGKNGLESYTPATPDTLVDVEDPQPVPLAPTDPPANPPAA